MEYWGRSARGRGKRRNTCPISCNSSTIRLKTLETRGSIWQPALFWNQGFSHCAPAQNQYMQEKSWGLYSHSREYSIIFFRIIERFRWRLSGPLNRLNAILSLLHPLDRYRTPSAIGSAIGRPLSRPISHPNTVVGVLNRTVLNRLGGSTAR